MPVPKPVDTPSNNLLLDALPKGEFEKLLTMLEYIELEAGRVLWESDEKGRHLYFPTTSLISLNYESDSGSSISIATIGRNGIVGTGIVMGNVRTPDRAVVHYEGAAYRIKAETAVTELEECGDLQALMMTYTQALLTKISQNAICNRLHRIDQQLCRLLLDFSDELQTETFNLTHDVIASILGVRRESVSLATGQLQKRKIIRASRGKLRIDDRGALSTAACECYEVAKTHLDQSLSQYRSEHAS